MRFARPLLAAVWAAALLAAGQLGAQTLPHAARTASVDLGHGISMEFVLIPAGSFTMGSDENSGSDDESPLHRVAITHPFFLGKFEVTQEQWLAVMGTNPSKFCGARFPVESVTWNEVQAFLSRLHALTGCAFTLPTEAQWEYACRAGTTTVWSFGDRDDSVGDFAWLAANSTNTTHPVGQKKPNPWGLYDMHGNVAEWCSDWYAKHTYASGDVSDPTGPATGDARIVRGGAWGDGSDYLRCAYRNCVGPTTATYGIGLRCVMLADAPPRAPAPAPAAAH